MVIEQDAFIPSLVLVQPRETRPYITERLLMGRKELNQTSYARFCCKILLQDSAMIFATVHSLMNYTHLIDSCQAHLHNRVS